MNEFNTIFFGLYVTILLTPVMAYVFRSRFVKSNQKFILTTLILVAMTFILSKFGISFLGVTIDALALYFLYLLSGVAMLKATTYKNYVIKAISGIGFLPFLIFPLLSVPAVVGVVLSVGDFTTEYATNDGLGKSCRVTTYGNATTSTVGYNILVHKYFGILEYQLDSEQIETTRNPNLTPEKLCKLSFSRL